MTVEAIAPNLQSAGLLEGTTYADAYRLRTNEPDLDAITATRRVMQRMPRWTSVLLNIRNVLVTPFGLKRAGHHQPPGTVQIGPFPVISQTPQRVVLGFDDKHLDFRLVVDSAGGEITGTTLIRTHNLLGRAYLAVVLPFHHIIVPAMLRRAVPA